MQRVNLHVVTGSSGFIGRHLVRELLNRNEQVAVLIRPADGVSAYERARHIFGSPENLHVIQGDILLPGLGLSDRDARRVKESSCTLWHLAADLSFSPGKSKAARQTNVEGTSHVVTFANAHAMRLVHMSTAYVCGDHTQFSEGELDSGQRFRNHYAATKYEAERVVRAQSCIPTIIIRPSIVIGDAYEGKAEGCTFGYYRFAFMLHVFASWIRSTMLQRGIAGWFLRLLGTELRQEGTVVYAPWVVLPYPSNGVVDLVSVDYVVEAALALIARDDAWGARTFHFTQEKPLDSLFVMQSAMEDLCMSGARYIRVSPAVFTGILWIVYALLFPLRSYVKSVFWYIPYVVRPYHFDQSNARAFAVLPPRMDRESLRRINKYAKEHVFPGIQLENLF